MKITRKQLRQLIYEMAKPTALALINPSNLPKVESDVGVVLTPEDYKANKKKMGAGLQVARFAHSAPVPLYRILDEAEFNIHIPRAGGVISGGIFQPEEERMFGASFGFDPVQLINDFAKGQQVTHLHSGNNYLVQIPDANGLPFGNMELTYDTGGFRQGFGLSGGSRTSPYKSSFGASLKKGMKVNKDLPYNFTVPPDMCHGLLGCQMIIDAKQVGAKFYQINSKGMLIPITPTWMPK